MSSTAVAGLTIFIVLVVILVSGMPIAVALAASSMIAIVQLLTVRQPSPPHPRSFSRESPFSPCWPFLSLYWRATL